MIKVDLFQSSHCLRKGEIMLKKTFHLCFFSSLLMICFLEGAIKGRIDVGATLMDIDILESGKTVKTLHMKGVKGDASFFLYEGLCLKPSFLWGKGHGGLTAGTLAVGYMIPTWKKILILPNVGATWCYLHTRVSFEELGLHHLKERFRSCSPFIGMEICYPITDQLTIMALYQYAWSHTHTKIKPIVSQKSHSCGPNYALSLDYSLNKQLSLTFGVGYNITLSKEKHGLRGKGAKLGLAYYF